MAKNHLLEWRTNASEEWIGLHRAELLHNWTLAQAGQPLLPIDPLP